MKEDRQSSMELGENLDEVQKSRSVSPIRRNFYRMLKMAAFILCLTGFGFQTAEFLSTFYTYPTVLNIKSERMQQFPTPALTFCSRYTLNFEKYCEKYRGKCSRNNITKTATPKYLPTYDEDKDFLYNVFSNSDEVIEVKIINHSNEEFGEKFFFEDHFNGFPHACYRYGNGLKDGYLHNMTVYDYEKIMKWADFSLFFKQAGNVFLDPQPYGTLYIHSPFLTFKEFEKKITVKPNYYYYILISLQEEKLLPSPYDTNCTDYLSLWKENGGTGPLSREMCQHNCFWESDYFASNENPIEKRMKCYGLIHKENREDDPFWPNCKCYVECKEDCLVLNYDYTYLEGKSIDTPDPYAYVNIFIEENKVQISTYKAQYMNVERFSYVGGFLGCWLGISIWTANGILWRAYYCAVAKAKGWTTALRPPPPLEGAARPEAETKETS